MSNLNNSTNSTEKNWEPLPTWEGEKDDWYLDDGDCPRCGESADNWGEVPESYFENRRDLAEYSDDAYSFRCPRCGLEWIVIDGIDPDNFYASEIYF